MIKLFKKGLEFIKSGQGFWLAILLPFFFKGETNHRILQLKLELVLKNKIKKIVKNFETIEIPEQINERKQPIDENTIWFMWLQGIENAPDLVKNNFFYLQNHFGTRVKLITSENIESYLNVPKIINKKWKNKIISNTHFSDIIRVQLLVTYGGIWIDSTVFAKEKFIKFVDTKYFIIPRTFAPGSDGKTIPISSWFIKSERDNYFLKTVQAKLVCYWTNKNNLVTYFLLHYLLVLTSEEMDDYFEKTFPIDNTLPHYLMLHMRKQKISKEKMEFLIKQFSLMKFTNKTVSSLESDNYETLNSILSVKGADSTKYEL
ncbi:capsular polysaccharide synthesis protein [Weissella paramesenteroides]|uniref:capsular polysaccharide synthesis protein n=1 Tax=Weissella paramesenteroides TaxID=1249 RepID=UPI00207411F0|nr:capsular polysaccharide synthesis protein [Weissella paramesenteroides]MCM6765386.1 capsular polysaccharide synthesis protein [Weissella paramesenteroides]MCM6766757.1 capsular polysaccharide synthesis protein [Weissella paramesenteroides]MCM6771479.1 capsular polysaccharide synthesis protein [Weissella paramesenteroides]MCM6779428.1 capsular polysaccharide synthesis protein [Weissella paramesenteroides]MCM6782031.1 capsular polysaccharide synthesis protein [Weissella paramesenteroides]